MLVTLLRSDEGWTHRGHACALKNSGEDVAIRKGTPRYDGPHGYLLLFGRRGCAKVLGFVQREDIIGCHILVID